MENESAKNAFALLEKITKIYMHLIYTVQTILYCITYEMCICLTCHLRQNCQLIL